MSFSPDEFLAVKQRLENLELEQAKDHTKVSPF